MQVNAVKSASNQTLRDVFAVLAVSSGARLQEPVISNQGGSSSSAQPTAVLDARGLNCPEPLMLARHALRPLAPGAVLEISATDPSTVRDFEQLCRFLGHELLTRNETEGVYHFRIRKGGE